jgi:hypothetical protein
MQELKKKPGINFAACSVNDDGFSGYGPSRLGAMAHRIFQIDPRLSAFIRVQLYSTKMEQ